MKNLFALFCIIATIGGAAANANPMFGGSHQDSVSIYIGQGTGSGNMFRLIDPAMWNIQPMTITMAQYSQPITVFRLPARQNLNIIQNTAYNSARGLSFLAAGISWDVVPLSWCGWYIGVGIGPYYRDSHDRYVESRLVFGEKFFVGKNINDNWRAEFFTLHFSNGDFTEINKGFNFTGLAASYSF